jgi:hypothetical protein
MQSQRVLSALLSKQISRTALWFALALYIPIQIVAGIAQREQMNLDGIAYLRLSGYIVEGRLSDSISSYWSPLLSWSIAPLLAMGLDGFDASHIAMSVWGAAYLVATFFSCGFSRLRTPWDVAFMLVAALVAVSQVARLVAPDVIMSCLLLLYSGVTLVPVCSGRKGLPQAPAYWRELHIWPNRMRCRSSSSISRALWSCDISSTANAGHVPTR